VEGKKKTFIVRKHNPSNGKISDVGPFHDEKDAQEAASLFLKKGVCSWVVRYYDYK
tara:strand:+ start:185 stop:352 length:168 start_codon:yes stop_codon:yes gene_type:complete